MEVNGMGLKELKSLLKEMGVSSKDRKEAISIFNNIDSNQNLEVEGAEHGDNVLSGTEMQEFLERAKDLLGEKIESLRKSFMSTGGYVEKFGGETTEYDKNGNKVRVTEESYSRRTRSYNKSVQTYAYDDKNNVIRVVEDKNADGQDDFIGTSEYDDNNNLVRCTYDKNADGNPDIIENHAYDERNNEISVISTDADGHVFHTHRNEYDEMNRKVREEVHKEGNEETNGYDWIKTWEYDKNGNVARFTHDEGADGKVDAITTWEYDEHGNKIREVQDEDGDGKADQIHSWEYDENGKEKRWIIDSDADGNPDNIIR